MVNNVFKSNLDLFSIIVERAADLTCSGHGSLKLYKPSGYLSNYIVEVSSKGSAACPWILQGSRGQKFTISLIDYGTWSDEGSTEESNRHPSKSGLCHIYAQIREAGATAGSNIILCGGEQKEQVVYTSETHSVHIELTNPKATENAAYFILKYQGKC